MEIIKEPNCIVECSRCSCQFKFDKNDVYSATGGSRKGNPINPHKAVLCPICGKSIPILGTDRKEDTK